MSNQANIAIGLMFVALAALLIGSGTICAVRLQQAGVVLQPGEAVEVVCATCPPCATLTPTPTDTPTPIDTPIPPTPTSTPSPSTTWHGVVRSPENAWDTMRTELSASVVELLVRPSTSDAAILASLDNAQAQGLQVLLHVYDSASNTQNPWTLDGDTWTVTARGAEILALVEGHSAIWAVYQLHEPFDSATYHADADAQRVLYALLKTYTSHDLYTDLSSIHLPHQASEVMSDEMCDQCCTAPTIFRGAWTSEECLTETFARIDADLAVKQEFMPGSNLVFMFNVYTLGDGTRYRMPTAVELDTVRDYMCGLDVPPLYYPWQHSGYTTELGDAPELWPLIAEGCGGQPVTPTPTAEATPTPTGEPTDTPAPTSTPSGGAVIVDHTADVASLTQAQLDAAREAVTFFNHKSIGNNILDGIADLQAQDPARYTIAVQYSSGTAPGLNHYQVGGNGAPLTKISGFAPLVKDDHDLAMMKFCTGDCPCVQGDTPMGEVWATYRDMMVASQVAHPDTALVWWTWPLIASDHSRAYCNEELAEFNDAVRAYVGANGGVLFDIADIESHDADGNPVTAGDWEAAWPGWTSDGAHLNEAGRQRVAGALWVLLAEVVSAY